MNHRLCIGHINFSHVIRGKEENLPEGRINFPSLFSRLFATCSPFAHDILMSYLILSNDLILVLLQGASITIFLKMISLRKRLLQNMLNFVGLCSRYPLESFLMFIIRIQ